MIRGANTYPDFDEALFAVVQSDPLAIVGEATISSTNAANGRIFSFTNTADAAKIHSVAEPGYFGEAIASATAGRYTLNWTTNAPPSYSTWFSADSASNAIRGGHWRQVAVRSGGRWPIRPASPGIFEAYSSREGRPRIDVTISPYGGYLPSKLPELLVASVERGDRAALVAVEEDDGWIFCDFEKANLLAIAAEIEADQDARYVFLVTHGPFTAYDSANWRWRLSAWTGKGGTGQGVPELFEAISRRRAIVLSGHTHTTAFYRNENRYGGYTEFTANSVWEEAALATAEPIHDRPSQYGSYRRSQVSASLRSEYDADIAFFKAGLREYFFSLAAGHYRLEVSDDAVKMLFYPGAATEPGRVFDLTPGPPRFRGIIFTIH